MKKMGIPIEIRDGWVNWRRYLFIALPTEEQKLLIAKQRSQDAVWAGLKAGSIACVATAIPTV